MAEESGAAISSGQGTGWAQVFQGSGFDGAAFVNNLRLEGEKKQQAEIARQIELQKENRKAFGKHRFDIKPTRWGDDAIRAMSSEYIDGLTELSMSGKNYDSPEVQRYIQKATDDLKTAGEKAAYVDKVQAGYAEMVRDPANIGKVSMQQYLDWEKGLREVKDSGDIDAMVEYADNNLLFEPVIETEDILSVLKIPINSVVEGGKYVDEADPEVARAMVKTRIEDMYADPANRPLIESYYNRFSEGPNKRFDTPGGMLEFLTNEAVNKYGRKERKISTSKGKGGININVAGSAGTKYFQATATYDENLGGEQDVVNALVLSSDTGDVKPIELSVGGQDVYVKPGTHIGVRPDGSFVLTGKKAKRVTGDQIKKSGKSFEDFWKDEGVSVDQVEVIGDGSGDYVVINETETVNVPFREGDVNYTKIAKLLTKSPKAIVAERQKELDKKRGATPAKKGITADQFFALPFADRMKYKKSGNTYILK